MQSLVNLIDRFSRATGHLLRWLTLLMVILTFVIVILRYLFDWGSIGMQEAVMYMHALFFMGAAAYALERDAHVRVDIFYQNFSARRKAWIDLLGTLFFLLPFCFALIYLSLPYVERAWSLHETSSEPGGLPLVYLLKTLIPVMAGLLTIQGTGTILRSLLTIRDPSS